MIAKAISRKKFGQTIFQTSRSMCGYVGRKYSEEVIYSPSQSHEFATLLTPSSSADQSEVVSGCLVSCIFSRIIGSNFPLSIYLSQTINIHTPIHYGVAITGEVEVVKDLGRNRYEL